MGMLDGRFWIVYGGELLGVTEDGKKVEQLLQDDFLKENLLPERFRPELGIRLKFDQLRLTRNGVDVPDYYAVNAPEL